MVQTSYSGSGVPDHQEGGSVWQQEDFGDVVTDPGRCDKNLNTESRNNTQEGADYRGIVDAISIVLGVGGGAESTMGVFPGWGLGGHHFSCWPKQKEKDFQEK